MIAPLPNRISLPMRNRTSTAGVALIIVLCMLVLAAALVVAFLTSVATELRSAKSYAVGLDSRALADSAVNIVTSQIQDATAAATNAWASQPGMIRTYNSSGNLVMAYKLYSSDTMRTGTFNPVTSVSTEVPSNWNTLPDQYTDLNKPVTNSGVVHYPIIDPAAVAASQSSTTAMDNSTAPIQGCYIDQTNPDAGLCVSGTTANPVPMPVKWLYVLQDGTIATITSTGSVTATSSTGSTITPTKSNPIVGRIAFWTDDESCKVNINTSAEGVFYGRTWADSAGTTTGGITTYYGYERNFLGFTLPAQNESQRYPGHPAMTSLSVIFPAQNGESTAAYNERVYGIIPRLGTGGSQSGTQAVTATGTTNLTGTVTLNSYRLFPTVDEFMFSATGTTTPRTANLKSPTASFTESDIEKARFFLTANSRAPEVNMFNKPRITLWPLQANTASVANPTSSPYWTSKDKLIAFCSTIGSTPYYFQRYNTFTSPVRSGAMSYPASLTQNPIPSSQSPTLDWANIPRNQSLFSYLQYLTSNPIPGLGGSFSGTGGKYKTSVCNQILTEMMDFIRSEITLGSTGTTPSYYYAPSQSNGRIMTGDHQVVPLVITPPGASGYQTKGYGRFETLTHAAFVFYRLDPGKVTGSASINYSIAQQTVNTVTGSLTTATPSGTNVVNIGVVLLLNPYNCTPGSRAWSENMRVQVQCNPAASSGGPFGTTSSILVNGAACNGSTAYGIPAGFPAGCTSAPYSATVLLNGLDEQVNSTALFGPEFFFYYNNNGSSSYKSLGQTSASSGNNVGSVNEEKYYPFYGAFTITTTGTTFQFTPPDSLTIKLYSGYDLGSGGNPSSSALVQTITMPFPSGAIVLPVPTVTMTTSGTVGTFSEKDNNNLTTYSNRFGWMDVNNGASGSHSSSGFFLAGDSARCVEVRYGGSTSPYNLPQGDLRLVAGLANVPASYFNSYKAVNVPASDDNPASSTALASSAGAYASSTSALVNSFRMFPEPGVGFANNGGYYGGFSGPYGSLIAPAGTGYFSDTSNPVRRNLYPAVPRGLSSSQVQLTGLNNNLYPGDWDTGPGNQPDGCYINKPDDSNSATQLGSPGSLWSGANNMGGGGPYDQGTDQYAPTAPDEAGNTYSPNRLISSAVSFGSLPTGIDPTGSITLGGGVQSTGGMHPWQTLLFCPNPASEAGNGSNTLTATPRHPGFGSNSTGGTNAPPYTIPPDSAFLDFFTMPIVEPYAISEPFSTAGKVNMNYQIVPFTYLTRDTGIRAVLKPVRVMALPTNNTGGGGTYGTICYKEYHSGPGDYRYTINPDEATGTLAGFQNRFASGDIFRSATEICNLYLVPQYQVNCATAGAGESISTTVPLGGTGYNVTPTYSNMNTWWQGFTLTGDNVREEPYGYIYPRLTTKSNTFMVHVIAQTVQKASTSAVGQFVSSTDQVTSEYRGSVVLQRYLDPNSDSLISTDGSTPSETNPNSMVGPYKYRVIGMKRFAP